MNPIKTPIITTQNVSKHYGTHKALENLSFELQTGEILGLLGPNGAGKTTTLHLLLGLLTPTSGNISVMGVNPSLEKEKICSRLNFSSSYSNLPGNLNVSENLKIFSRLYAVPEADKKIKQLLDLFEISHLAGQVTASLSSGERTRLNLVRGLLNDPELLILDEPTSSLDPHIADKVRSILKTVRKERNISILYTSHNMPEVETMCDRVLFIHHGKKIAEGTSAEVRMKLSASSLEHAFIKIVRDGDLISEENR